VKTDERELLAEKIPDFALDTVAGSGQYVHEEQPQVVVEALGSLDKASD